MSANIPANLKHCATCIYWTGDRKFNSNTHQAEVDDSNKAALCTNKKQYSGSGKFIAHFTCPNYEEHPSVK